MEGNEVLLAGVWRLVSNERTFAVEGVSDMLSVRKWDGSAYVLQDERDITAELKEISSIKWKLDWESYGLWNASNCTIALRNDHNRFREGIGYLAGGGILHGAQVRVLGGESGETLTTLFTGTITADPVYDMTAFLHFLPDALKLLAKKTGGQ